MEIEIVALIHAFLGTVRATPEPSPRLVDPLPIPVQGDRLVDDLTISPPERITSANFLYSHSVISGVNELGFSTSQHEHLVT